jgi:hypothetical protein
VSLLAVTLLAATCLRPRSAAFDGRFFAPDGPVIGAVLGVRARGTDALKAAADRPPKRRPPPFIERAGAV